MRQRQQTLDIRPCCMLDLRIQFQFRTSLNYCANGIHYILVPALLAACPRRSAAAARAPLIPSPLCCWQQQAADTSSGLVARCLLGHIIALAPTMQSQIRISDAGCISRDL